MNQIKFGKFLNYLRKENNLTQEQFAEIFGVSNRSVSRWENGNNMPDIASIIEISAYFNVGIDELFNGERRTEDMDIKTQTTILDVAQLSNEEKNKIMKKSKILFYIASISLLIYCIIQYTNLIAIDFFTHLDDFMLGVATSTLIGGILFTSKIIYNINCYKKSIFNKIKNN